MYSASFSFRIVFVALAMCAPVSLFAGQSSGVNLSRRGMDPERRRLYDQVSDAINTGRKAQAKKNYGLAERLFQQACDFEPNGTGQFRHIYLARLYDEMGRDREAYREYRLLLAPNPRGSSSDQTDAKVLLRYGTLCERFGELREARLAYGKAAADAAEWVGPTEPVPTPTNSAISSLRAAARAAAALEEGATGSLLVMLNELDRAVADDPNCWAARFHRARCFARLGSREKTTKELILTERLAPASASAAIEQLRSIYDIPDANGKIPPRKPARG